MNANDLINAIGSIDDRYVLAYTAGATPHKRKPVTPLFRWSAAACVAVVAALSLMLLPTMTRHHSVMPKPDHTPTPPDSGGQMSPLPDAPATTTTTAGGDGFSNNELVTTTTHPTAPIADKHQHQLNSSEGTRLSLRRLLFRSIRFKGSNL